MLHRLRQGARRARLAFLLMLALTGCRDTPPQAPPPGTFTWKEVRSAALGLSLRAPSVYVVSEEGLDLAFRYHGTPVRLLLVTPDEARRRGLWVRVRPLEAVRVAGRDGQRYVYDHHDGPFYSHTVAYVFPHRGRQLGIEFRTDADALDPVQAEMLASLQFQ